MTDDDSLFHIWCPWCAEFIAPHTERGVAQAYMHTEEHQDVGPDSREVEKTYVLAPKFDPGDVVQDVDTPPGERGSMRVLRLLDEPARVHAVNDDKTVAEYNPGHPPGAPVYECVFEGWLDSNVPTWKDHTDGWLASYLDDYEGLWSVSTRTYDYPGTRLVPRPRCDECGDRLDWVETLGGYTCPNSDRAGNPNPTCNSNRVIAAFTAYGGEYEPSSHGNPDELLMPVETLGTAECPVCLGEGTVPSRPEPMTCPNCDGGGLEVDGAAE